MKQRRKKMRWYCHAPFDVKNAERLTLHDNYVLPHEHGATVNYP